MNHTNEVTDEIIRNRLEDLRNFAVALTSFDHDVERKSYYEGIAIRCRYLLSELERIQTAEIAKDIIPDKEQ